MFLHECEQRLNQVRILGLLAHQTELSSHAR
jgi:hypothetical protein